MYLMIFCGKSAQGLILEVYLGIDHETKKFDFEKVGFGKCLIKVCLGVLLKRWFRERI